MAFYRSSDSYDLYGQTYKNPYEQQVPPNSYPANPSGGTRFSGRWLPGAPNYMNEVRTAGKRSRTAGRIAPGLLGRYQDSDPYTPNPYGVDQYEIRNNPQDYNQGEMWAKFEGRRYLGGYSDDYVSQTTVPMPYGEDNVSMRYFATKDKRVPVYGRPVYREGMEANYPGIAHLTPDGIRSWQSFFQMNGFKTGPSGFWTEYEMNAMRAFMTMANGTPGGGMTVENLRARVEQDITSGALLPGELAPSLGGDLNENALDGTAGGGGGGGMGADMIPYTQTTVETQTNSISADQGLMVLMDYWQRRTGRAPSQGELSRFVKGVNAAMRADPSVITTVVTTDPMAGTTDTTVTRDESEVDPQAMALTSSLEDAPAGEVSEYQAGRYIDMLMGELGI